MDKVYIVRVNEVGVDVASTEIDAHTAEMLVNELKNRSICHDAIARALRSEAEENRQQATDKDVEAGERGSPAWAGIDPTAVSTVKRQTRFPRVGGDRPPQTPSSPRMGRVPPRGRG